MSKRLKLVEEKASETGFKGVQVVIKKTEAPVEVRIEGKCPDGTFRTLRSGLVGGNPDQSNLDVTFQVPIILDGGEPYTFREVRVHADKPLEKLLYEERA